MNTYIQDKLDELIKTYRKTTVIYEKQNGDEVKEKVNSYFTEYDARMIAERLVADYNNNIVEKLKMLKRKHYNETAFMNHRNDYNDAHNEVLQSVLSLLQDINPKE